MAPEPGTFRDIEQLSADDTPSREGAWWIMLQTAESICNYASLRDPVNNAFLPEFWTDAAKGVAPLLYSKAERPPHYDDLMQLVSYCGDQLREVFQTPRYDSVKADKMVMPQRLKDAGSKTMNWFGRLPGRTVREKLAGKNRILTQVNTYSYDIRENQVAVMLYRQIMRRAAARMDDEADAGPDDPESPQMAQLRKLKTALRGSPLNEVHAKNHARANNALLSDKNYSVIWRAYLDMEKYDKRQAEKWTDALSLYEKTVFLALNAELLTYKDVRVLEDRVNLSGRGALRALYAVGCQRQVPYIIELRYSGSGISAAVYELLPGRTQQSRRTLQLSLTFSEAVPGSSLAVGQGTPLKMTVRGGQSADMLLYGDLSGIRAVCTYLTGILFPFAHVEPLKRADTDTPIEGSIAFDLASNGESLGIAVPETGIIPGFCSHGAVSYPDQEGTVHVFPSGSHGLHPHAAAFTAISSAVSEQNYDGLNMALEDIRGRSALGRGDYFFYLVPDALEELLQKNLKQCIRSWFPRTFPVWRSVAALTYWLHTPGYAFHKDTVLACIDLAGKTAAVGMLTIHEEKTVHGYVCNHFPPFPQTEEDDDITDEAFCRRYAEKFSSRHGLHIPEAVIKTMADSGQIRALILHGGCANQFVEESGRITLYQISYDRGLLEQCTDDWLAGLRKFWSRVRGRFAADRPPEHLLFLSDLLPSVCSQLHRSASILLNTDERTRIQLHYNTSGSLLHGALIYKDRLNQKLPTWTEYLPHLSLEVIKDGEYAELELIGDDVSFDVLGEDNAHTVSERLVLKAHEREYRFPLVRQDISRRLSMIDAYITDRSFPLDHDVVAALSVKYCYGFDNSYELTLRPVDENETAFREIVVEWANTSQRKNAVNIWPPAPSRLSDDEIRKLIGETKVSFIKIQQSIERHMVSYTSPADKSYQISQTKKFLSMNQFKVRSILMSDLPEAEAFFAWFIGTPLYKYLGQLAGLFVHQDIPESFFADHAGTQLDYFERDCLQVMFSAGRYTPAEVQARFVNHYNEIGNAARMKGILAMLLRNGGNHEAVKVIFDEVKQAYDLPEYRAYNAKMGALIAEFGNTCSFDSDLVYDLYRADPSFMCRMTKYIVKGVGRMLNRCERFGEQYIPKDWDIKQYIRYMKALLCLLRLRDPDRAEGFDLLAVGSDDSRRLARDIRILDDYMNRGGPVNPAIRFKLEKPEQLSKVTDLSYALDLYLKGDQAAASIEVVGVDEED